jgi:hypothetical protein
MSRAYCGVWKHPNFQEVCRYSKKGTVKWVFESRYFQREAGHAANEAND